jgi:hypothetical protein
MNACERILLMRWCTADATAMSDCDLVVIERREVG